MVNFHDSAPHSTVLECYSCVHLYHGPVSIIICQQLTALVKNVTRQAQLVYDLFPLLGNAN